MEWPYCVTLMVAMFTITLMNHDMTCWEVFSLGRNHYPGVDPFSLIRYLERGERLDKPLNVTCSQEMSVDETVLG